MIVEPLVVSAKQLGEMLGMSERTIRRLDAGGKLPVPLKIGGSTRWRLDEIRGWLRAGSPSREKWETLCRGSESGACHGRP